MNERERKNLKRQITMQANSIDSQTDVQLSLSMLATGEALLQGVSKTDVAKLSKSEIENLYTGYLAIGAQVIDFFDNMKKNEAVQSPVVQTARLLDDLKKAREAALKLQGDLAAQQKELTQLTTRNDALAEQVEEAKAELAKEEERATMLADMSAACAPAIIEAQRQKNEQLSSEFAKRKTVLEEVQEEETELLGQKAELEAQIADVEQSIAAIPDAIKVLHTGYHEKTTLLEQLKSAEVDCSAENQAELQKQIDELLPVVQELETATTDLQQRLENLQQQRLTYDREKSDLSTNLFELLDNSIRGLAEIVRERETVISEIKAKADRLRESTEAADKTRAGYRSWFETTATPLQVMEKSLSKAEFAKLKETLDINATESVSKLMTEIEEALIKLDKILGPCVVAVRADQKILESRALR